MQWWHESHGSNDLLETNLCHGPYDESLLASLSGQEPVAMDMEPRVEPTSIILLNGNTSEPLLMTYCYSQT